MSRLARKALCPTLAFQKDHSGISCFFDVYLEPSCLSTHQLWDPYFKGVRTKVWQSRAFLGARKQINRRDIG